MNRDNHEELRAQLDATLQQLALSQQDAEALKQRVLDLEDDVARLQKERDSARAELKESKITARLQAMQLKQAKGREAAYERTIGALNRTADMMCRAGVAGFGDKEPPPTKRGRPTKLTTKLLLQGAQMASHGIFTTKQIAEALGTTPPIVARFLARTYQTPDALEAYRQLGWEPWTPENGAAGDKTPADQ